MIKVNLVHVDLDQLDEAPFAFYEALSYTWVDSSLPRLPCKLNGHEHTITANPESLLKNIRGRARKRYLWVDALCINQDDITERASQVQLMRRIYESAEKVLVWLDDDADDSVSAIELIDRLTDADCPDDYLERSIFDMKGRAQWLAVARFFDRPWFRRVWVQQEIAVAKSIIVLCGKQRVNWNTLSLTTSELRSPEIKPYWDYLGSMVSRRSSGTGYVDAMDMLREDLAKHQTVDSAFLFGRGRAADATDARDLVYGLLGLSDIADKLAVNYAISPQEVFTRATITLLGHHQRLDPLSGCQWRDGMTSLPSWVLNLNEDLDALPLRSKESGEFLYGASGDESALYVVVESNNLLRARGFIVDIVHVVGKSLDSYDLRNLGIEQCFEDYLQVAQQAVALRSSGPICDNLMEEFCKTLAADQDESGDRATAEFYRPYSDGQTLTTLPKKLAYAFEDQAGGLNNRMYEVLPGRLMLGTSKGYIGIAGQACKPKDIVCILFGAGVPFIVRSRGSEYILIGEAYIHGIMDGEAVTESRSNGQIISEIALC